MDVVVCQNLQDSLWFPRHQLLSARSAPSETKSLNRSLAFDVFAFFYAAAAGAVVAAMPWRSGSYTSPLTQRQCSRTASFRATATAARFFAFFPPRSHNRSPYRRKSVSGPNGPKIYCALPTNSLRTIVSPALLIPNCG